MATLLKHSQAEIPSLCQARDGVPAALDSIFRRMLAKRPEERFASMAEVVQALEALALAAPRGPAPTPAVASAPAGREGGTAEAASPTVDFRSAGTSDTAGMTVLLVEPSRSQAVIIRGYLQKLGVKEVPTTPSGENALQVARETSPRVVISAMHLADMTGVQLAQKIRAEGPLSSTGFILITSQADAQEVSSLSQAGHTVRLPKPFDLDQLGQALSVAGRTGPAREAGPARIGNLRVLVVDDSAAARVHIRSVLAGLGLRHVVEAADGAEAVALLQRETYDLVVTDYTMPRLDGRGLVDFIRRRSPTPSVPVIVVTSESDPAKLDALRRLGVSAICDKSFKREEVRGLLERLG
jgi:two-component system chemotaxis response regulator CheY